MINRNDVVAMVGVALIGLAVWFGLAWPGLVAYVGVGLLVFSLCSEGRT